MQRIIMTTTQHVARPSHRTHDATTMLTPSKATISCSPNPKEDLWGWFINDLSLLSPDPMAQRLFPSSLRNAKAHSGGIRDSRRSLTGLWGLLRWKQLFHSRLKVQYFLLCQVLSSFRALTIGSAAAPSLLR